MNITDFSKLKDLKISLDDKKNEIFNNYVRIFLEKNSHVNLISKNDEKFLFEKHIYDSLAINLAISPRRGETLLDIGTGGGFPSIPAAILYDELEVYAMDSIKKKIAVIKEIKKELGLENLHPICDRAENDKSQYDCVTCRAVSAMDTIIKYAAPRVKTGGLFIAYKSQKVEEELNSAEKIIKKSGLKLVKTIEYTLPLDETYTRNLVVFKKK